MTEQNKIQKYGVVIGSYESESRPGKFYEVRLNADGNKTCNCRGWATHRNCWHVESAQIPAQLKVG